MSVRPGSARGRPALAFSIAALLAAASCASVDFTRSSTTSGHFSSTGWALTVLSIDFPKEAQQIARENASDSGLPNMVIEDEIVLPHLWHFDWLLDILSLRYARISGTWGYDPQQSDEPGAAGPLPGS
jgi:hypothetical protein